MGAGIAHNEYSFLFSGGKGTAFFLTFQNIDKKNLNTLTPFFDFWVRMWRKMRQNMGIARPGAIPIYTYPDNSKVAMREV